MHRIKGLQATIREATLLMERFAHVEFQVKSLFWFRGHQLGAAHKALAEGMFDDWERPLWEQSRGALVSLFALEAPSTCLVAEPVRWVYLRETDVTRGFEDFLTVGSGRAHIARALALVEALSTRQVASLDEKKPEPNKVKAEEARIDLYVISSQNDSQGAIHQSAVVIEAKLDHCITPRQLARYKKYALKQLNIPEHLCTFRLLAPYIDRRTHVYMKRNTSWSFISWARFLTLFDAALPAKADDAEFKQFRRTVWRRAYNI